MPTRKLKRNLRRTSKNNKMKRGGIKRVRSSEQEPEPEPEKEIKKSARLTGKKTLDVPTVAIGNGDPTHEGYGLRTFTDKQIDDFVENAISGGYQIVSLPTPPESHSIIVNVERDKIMISDWNGTKGLEIGTQQNKLSRYSKKEKDKLYEKWRLYAVVINKISRKYDRPVEFYPVDTVIEGTADKKVALCGQGGCSEYAHLWLEKQVKPYGFSPVYYQKRY